MRLAADEWRGLALTILTSPIRVNLEPIDDADAMLSRHGQTGDYRKLIEGGSETIEMSEAGARRDSGWEGMTADSDLSTDHTRWVCERQTRNSRPTERTRMISSGGRRPSRRRRDHSSAVQMVRMFLNPTIPTRFEDRGRGPSGRNPPDRLSHQDRLLGCRKEDQLLPGGDPGPRGRREETRLTATTSQRSWRNCCS